jgi:23S rRNA pseudouridine1911/1915/1917 synthase
MRTEELNVTTRDAGKRLDVFVHERFRDLSRAWIQRLIKEKKVMINAEKASSSRKLKGGEIVRVAIERPRPMTLTPEALKIPIVYEDKELLVINKPSGVVAHPAPSHRTGTLAHWLLHHHPAIKHVGEHELRPGIVHRLDKDASGLMVIAKTPEMFTSLKKMFKDRKVTKGYLVLAHGEVPQDRGEISLPIARSKSDPTRQRVLKKGSIEGREAHTSWRVKARYRGFTLLEVTPQTGRMHQIRVHLSAIGHPVAGDAKYGLRKGKGPEGLSRLFLHASFLSLPALEKQWKVTLPKELSVVLGKLEKIRNY